MSAPRLLVLGAAAVQDDLIRTAQDHGMTVHCCARDDSGPGARTADVFSEFSFLDAPRLLEYVRDNQIDAVYSTGSDIAMPAASEVSEALGLPRFVSSDSARTMNNKGAMRSRLVGTPGHVWFEVTQGEAPSNPPFPVIVKPVDSQGQRGVSLVRDESELPAAIAHACASSRTDSAIVEEYLEGPELSVNGYAVPGRDPVLFTSDRDTWPQFTGLVKGHVMPPRAVDPATAQEAQQTVAAAAAALGVDSGPFYAQVKATPRGPRIVEISPRLDGCHLWKLIRATHGVDLMSALVRHLVWGVAPDFAPTSNGSRFSIDFTCVPPGEPAPEAAPTDGHYVPYYRAGETVRPVNGRFEKIGYAITGEGVHS